MEPGFIFVIVIIAMVMWFVLRIVEISKRSSSKHLDGDLPPSELLGRLLERAEDLHKRVQNLEDIVRR